MLMNSSNEILYFLFRKFCFSYILHLAKTEWALRILSQKFTWSFVIKELWVLESHVPVNILLCSSYFTKVHFSFLVSDIYNIYIYADKLNCTKNMFMRFLLALRLFTICYRNYLWYWVKPALQLLISHFLSFIADLC